MTARFRAFAALVLSLALVPATAEVASAAPTADFTFAPAAPSVGDPVGFTFTGTCDVRCSVEWKYFQDGGSSLGTRMGTGTTIPYAFQTAGRYFVVVKATADNATNNFASETHVVDVTAGSAASPHVRITSAPANATRTTSASFGFEVTDTDDPASTLTTRCRLDAATEVCTSPKSYLGLTDGSHTFTVTATDPAGHQGSATASWVVDTTAPLSQAAVGASAFTLAPSVDVSWSATDSGTGVVRHDVRWRRASFDSGFGPLVLPAAWQGTTATHAVSPTLAPGFTYCFAARATDAAGNTSTWSPERCVARPLDDRRAAASPGWGRGNGPLFYQRTHTSTSRLGATLTRTGARVARVGVVATTCPSCGTVAVAVGGTRVGTLDLRSSVTHRRQVLALAPFSFRRGPVVVRTLSGGRLVQIDGLALSRS